MSRVGAIILAAGCGSRMNMDTTKQQLVLGGMSVLKRTVGTFARCDKISEIIVVARAEELQFAKDEVFEFDKVSAVVIGGQTRLESAKCGFSALGGNVEYVAIHDAARCLVTDGDICAVISDAEKYGAATAACRVTDTVNKVDRNGKIICTVNRDELVTVQTPQIFKTDLYKKAIKYVSVSDLSVTDDNMLMEKIGVDVHCTFTGTKNIKITVRDDLAYAKFLLNGDN